MGANEYQLTNEHKSSSENHTKQFTESRLGLRYNIPTLFQNMFNNITVCIHDAYRCYIHNFIVIEKKIIVVMFIKWV